MKSFQSEESQDLLIEVYHKAVAAGHNVLITEASAGLRRWGRRHEVTLYITPRVAVAGDWRPVVTRTPTGLVRKGTDVLVVYRKDASRMGWTPDGEADEVGMACDPDEVLRIAQGAL